MALALPGIAMAATFDAERLEAVLDYPIVYVRQPRHGDTIASRWPDFDRPFHAEPDSDLVLRHPDGSEQVLADVTRGAVIDPAVSFDGQRVYFAVLYQPLEDRPRRGVKTGGADLFVVDIPSQLGRQLTFDGLEGVFNTGPYPLPGGRLAFTSTRTGYRAVGQGSLVTQLYVMDVDGRNASPIAPMTHQGALHPYTLADGRLAFSSQEGQGLRSDQLWGVWSIYPDGREWEPMVGAFNHGKGFHWFAETSDGTLVVGDYYRRNNFAAGALYRIPSPGPGQRPLFHGADGGGEFRVDGFAPLPFAPRGMVTLAPWAISGDVPSPVSDGVHLGKLTHPSPAPDNGLLLVWLDGPANNRGADGVPMPDSGIYLLPEVAATVDHPRELQRVVNDSRWNEAQPRAVVPYGAIMGRDQPVILPDLPVEGQRLAPGEAAGLVGSISLLLRETTPAFAESDPWRGLGAFNRAPRGAQNWLTQGAAAAVYGDDEVWWVRILAAEPRPPGSQALYSHADARLPIQG
ncbi:MAG: TolB family protein, partial [Candidatus Competibacterales bacterium]